MHLSIKGDASAIDISRPRAQSLRRECFRSPSSFAGDGQREIDVALVSQPGRRAVEDLLELQRTGACSEGCPAAADFCARDDAKHAKPASIKLELYGCEYHVCMGVVHMSEAEVVKDIAAVLAKVRQGVEIVIEQDHRAIAVIKPTAVTGRKISEVIAALEAAGANAVIDEQFAHDVEEGIKAHREPWNPPSWD